MFVFSDKTYQALKKLVQIFIPAVSSAYFTLAALWDFPSPDKVVGSLAVLATFLGVAIGISNKTYEAMGGGNVGTVVITEDDDKKLYSLELNEDVDDLADKDTISFKVLAAPPLQKSVSPKPPTKRRSPKI